MATKDAYAAAERLLPDTWRRLVHGGVAVPTWIDGGPELTFVDSTAEGRRLRQVDAAGNVTDLPGPQVAVSPGTPAIGAADAPSPDRSRVCFERDSNLWVREIATGDERQLTFDGAPGYEYGNPIDVTKFMFLLPPLGIRKPPAVVWSANGTRLVTLRIDQREVAKMHLVQSRPSDGGRPRLHSLRYAMVGDEHLPTAELVCVDVTTGELVVADCGPQLAAYFCAVTAKEVWWAPDESEVLWLCYGRGARSLTLFATEPATGRTRVVHRETSDLPVMPKQDVMAMDATTIRSLPSGDVLWWSESSGWGHLSVVSRDGSVRPLTSGEWVVVDVVAADEEHVWFTGCGREPGLDPYVRSFYRVALASGVVEPLVVDGLDHTVHGSPRADRFVDVSSYLDRPAVSRLLDRDGTELAVLSSADATALFAAGYVPPERFCVKGADGTTDVWGVLYRPHGLEESQRYPVLDDTYPGPQLGSAHITFPCAGRPIGHLHGAAMAALGFAVVAIDGRGTPYRGRDFQMHAWLTGDDQAGLDDRVAALRSLGARHPWLDLDRVGIYGHSGGGYESARALMLQPDFYKVGVGSAGGHDALPYHAIWGETYVAPPGSDVYAQHAVEAHVDKLVGKLFLIHGELDENVTPYITLRLVDALISADKDVDLLIVPGEDHGLYFRQHHWWRRRWDYFVRHLLGAEPPDYRITPRPSILESYL